MAAQTPMTPNLLDLWCRVHVQAFKINMNVGAYPSNSSIRSGQ